MLEVKNLSIMLKSGQENLYIVDDISFSLKPGKCLAIIGESGCGKSMTANSLMRILPENAYYGARSKISFYDTDLLDLTEQQMQQVRGSRISMIFQDPMTSLNPVLSIADQLYETIRLSGKVDKISMVQRAQQLLSQVDIPDVNRVLKSYPHELSGGMKQRVMIAMMIAANPKLLIADEPTTALDVTTQSKILHILKELKIKHRMSLLFITHDLDVARDIADHVAVMYAGKIVEYADKEEIFNSALHPYTRRLFMSKPSMAERDLKLLEIPGIVPKLTNKNTKCAFLPRCSMSDSKCESDDVLSHNHNGSHIVLCHKYKEKNIKADERHNINRAKSFDKVVLNTKKYSVKYPIKSDFLRRTIGYFESVKNVTLELRESESLAIVGESGSGKTSLARSIIGLIEPSSGEAFAGDLNLQDNKQLSREKIQLIFQDPYSSLNPKLNILQSMSEAIKKEDKNETINIAKKILASVGLNESDLCKYPHEFSGGQRQRICIARALAMEPKIMICDEPTSALDMSIQAQILNLLLRLKEEKKLSYIFITHDFSVVSYIADYIAVMYRGEVVEYGAVYDILSSPQHEYTKKLLASAKINT